MNRIIQVVDSLDAGGAERVAVDLANGLDDLGYAVYFCVTRHDGPLHSDLNNNINFINLQRSKSHRGMLHFRKYIRENNISLVHAHGNSTASFCVLSLWGIRSVKIIHHDHNPLLNKRNVFFQKLILRHVHVWIAVSRDILHWIVKNIKYSKAIMLINPILISRFSKSFKATRVTKEIIVLANYREQKDFKNLISAAKLLKDRHLKFRINCFGAHSEGNYFKIINSKVERLQLEKLVNLNSSVTNVPTILSNADIGLLSSASEGLPISLLEYMASCLPVIVTDVGECKRLVSEANCGLVVPPQSPLALAEAIEKILTSEERWHEWGVAGRKYIEQNHSFDVYLDKMISDVYMKL